MRRRYVQIACVIACALLSLICAAVSAARVFPYTGPEPAPSLFGIDTGTYDTSHANYVRDIPTARRLGARWFHFTASATQFVRRAR